MKLAFLRNPEFLGFNTRKDFVLLFEDDEGFEDEDFFEEDEEEDYGCGGYDEDDYQDPNLDYQDE